MALRQAKSELRDEDGEGEKDVICEAHKSTKRGGARATGSGRTIKVTWIGEDSGASSGKRSADDVEVIVEGGTIRVGSAKSV